MTRIPSLVLLAAALAFAPAAPAGAAVDGAPMTLRPVAGGPHEPAPLILAQRTCPEARSCREAVGIWGNGYRRADGDGDGIPCESVCRSRSQVNEIRAQIGC
jgi:hypothetical protein